MSKSDKAVLNFIAWCRREHERAVGDEVKRLEGIGEGIFLDLFNPLHEIIRSAAVHDAKLEFDRRVDAYEKRIRERTK